MRTIRTAPFGLQHSSRSDLTSSWHHPTVMETTPLFDFTDSDAPSGWRIVNDTVMGGQSDSRFVDADGAARFEGTVVQDGGGFVSIRAPEGTYDVSGGDGLRLTVRGDGRRYNLTAYTQDGGGVSYRETFVPESEWATVDVRFDALTPYRRGRRVPGAPPFDPSSVRTIGILLADGKDGPFRLDLRQVEVWTE